MRKIALFLFVICILVLTACNQEGRTDESLEEGEEISEAQAENTVDTEEISEIDETEHTNTAEENTEQAEDLESLDDSETETDTTVETPDAASLLQQSYEAMNALDSLYMEGQMEVLEIMDGNEVKETRSFTKEMLLKDPFSQHYTIDIESNVHETISNDIYMLEDIHYILTSARDDQWRSIPAPEGSQQLSEYISNKTLESSIEFSNSFEVYAPDDVYELTFSGTYDEFMTTVFGAVDELMIELQKERPDGLDDVINSYKIIIDKETNLVKYYYIYHEQKIPEEVGDYFIVQDTVITVKNYDKYDDIVVPQQITDEAIFMADNAGDPTM